MPVHILNHKSFGFQDQLLSHMLNFWEFKIVFVGKFS